MRAYCLKCRASREIRDPKPVTVKKGLPGIQGKCCVCGARVSRLGSGDEKASANDERPVSGLAERPERIQKRRR